MLTMPRCLALLSTLILLPASVRAADPVRFAGAQAPPLLYVLSGTLIEGNPLIAGESLFILHSGATVRTFGFGRQNTLAGMVVTRASAPADRLAALNAAMVEARIGQQRDCQYAREDVQVERDFEITWFGRGERKHTFVATNRAIGAPLCSEEVVTLVEDLAQYANDLDTFPGAETLANISPNPVR